uniref:FKBP3 basic tilted helix bundle domain-containing protein n=1 Tax=Marmota marmota marmota TaxID=9994 RepID=A0A8C6A5K6_MARMA
WAEVVAQRLGWPVLGRLSNQELSREDIIKFLQNHGSVSFLAEHKLLGNILKIWPREVRKILVPHHSHIFANKHLSGFSK